MVLSVCIIFVGVVMLVGNMGLIEWWLELFVGLSVGLFNVGL